jgi:hypothetical protein
MFITQFALFATSDAVEIDRGTVRLWVRIGAIVVVVIAMAVGAIFMSRVARKIKKAGASLGWVYRRTGTPVAVHDFAGFPFAGLGSGEVDHEIAGVWRGHPAKVFVLHESPPQYSAKFQVTMLSLRSPMPLVEFHPRSNLQRQFSAETDVPTDSAEFNKRWRVMCRDPRYARAVATPRLMERLLAEGAAQNPVTVDGSSIYTWAPVHRAAGRDIQANLALLVDVAGLIPLRLGQFDGWGEAVSPDGHRTGTDSAVVAKPQRKKNYLAVLTVILAFTFLLAPLGILVGHASLRANRRGEASNHRWATLGLACSYGITAIIAGWSLFVVLSTRGLLG